MSFFRQVAPLLEQPGEADDRGQGRTQLMAHIGQEGGLGRRRRLGLAPRFLEFCLEQLGLGDVPDDVDRLDRLARVVEDQGRIGLHPYPAAVLALGPKAQGFGQIWQALGDQLVDRRHDHGQVVWMGHVDRADRRHLFGRIAEYPRRAWRDVAEVRVERDAHDHVVGVVGDEAVALLALAGIGLGALHLGDVGQHPDAGKRAAIAGQPGGAARHHMADLAIRSHDADLDGRIASGVGFLVLGQALAVVGMAEAVEGIDVGGGRRRIQAVDPVHLLGPDKLLSDVVEVPETHASQLGGEGRQGVEIVDWRLGLRLGHRVCHGASPRPTDATSG